ncbi:GH25 family lysozyme [Loigolactobacillus zhaoyuanensis]|uniref:GH25 family lysozyme n=1 Tax=Loigolactobacillus zhaoyuanensis TaxID=2486017 RepID=A0ABW8UIN4_9LACO
MVLNGIDIANYQTGIPKMPGDFRIVKATESTSYTNPAMADQIAKAPALLGFYHFASNGDVQAEANHFLATVKPHIGKAMLVLDYEPARPSVAWAKAWLDYVYQKTGVRPVIYMSLAVENAYDWSSVVNAGYGVWIAQYNNYNVVSGYQPRDLYGSLKHWPSMAMFQYTSSGRLSGWGASLDLDVFYGDKLAWAKYAAVSGKPVATVKASTPAVVNHTTRTKAAVAVNVTYELHQQGAGWLGAVTNFNNKNSNGFAGNPNHQHDYLTISVDHGSIKYRVHTVKSGWLDWVTKGDRNDLTNGAAGIAGHAITGVQIVYSTPAGESYQQAYYRSQTTQRAGWLGVCADDGSVAGFDSWAGEDGEPLDRLQIKISASNPF